MEEVIYFDDRFLYEGATVTIYFLEKVLAKENRNKTIGELLEKYNLLDKEQYVLNPSFLLSSLYSIFVLYYSSHFDSRKTKEKKVENDPRKKILEKLVKKYFCVKTGEDKDIVKLLRHSIAHYNIEFYSKNSEHFFSFKNIDNHGNVSFLSEISYLKLRLFIEEVSTFIQTLSLLDE